MGHMGRPGILVVALLLAAALVSGTTPRWSGQQQGEQLQQLASSLRQPARSLHSRARPGVAHGNGRSLRQATAPMCIFDEDEGCESNDDMIELSMGSPTTDTQKVSFYISYILDQQCAAGTTAGSCRQLAATGLPCTWAMGNCTSLVPMPSPTWLPGNVYCPGSLAEAAARCTAAQYDTSSPYSTPQARCFARPGCMWLNPPPGSDGADMGRSSSSNSSSSKGGPLTLADRPAALLISSILEPIYKMQQFNEDLSMMGMVRLLLSTTHLGPMWNGTCVPSWAVVGRTGQDLAARVDQRALKALSLGLPFDLAAVYLPIFDDLFGTCPGVQRIKRNLGLSASTCQRLGAAGCGAASVCQLLDTDSDDPDGDFQLFLLIESGASVADILASLGEDSPSGSMSADDVAEAFAAALLESLLSSLDFGSSVGGGGSDDGDDGSDGGMDMDDLVDQLLGGQGDGDDQQDQQQGDGSSSSGGGRRRRRLSTRSWRRALRAHRLLQEGSGVGGGDTAGGTQPTAPATPAAPATLGEPGTPASPTTPALIATLDQPGTPAEPTAPVVSFGEPTAPGVPFTISEWDLEDQQGGDQGGGMWVDGGEDSGGGHSPWHGDDGDDDDDGGELDADAQCVLFPGIPAYLFFLDLTDPWLAKEDAATATCAAAGEDATVCAATGEPLQLDWSLVDTWGKDTRVSWFPVVTNPPPSPPPSPPPPPAPPSRSPPARGAPRPGTNSGGAPAAWRPLVLSALAAAAVMLAAHLTAA